VTEPTGLSRKARRQAHTRADLINVARGIIAQCGVRQIAARYIPSSNKHT
jgi:hypothetical protein